MIIEGPDGKDRNTHRGLDSGRPAVEVQFNNITITIANVENAKQAYNILCEALASLEKAGYLVEWTTDTYWVLEREYQEEFTERSTKELFPT